MFIWSRGHSLWRRVHKIKAVVYVPNRLCWVGHLLHWPLGPRGAQWGSGASAVHFGGHFVKQKLLGTPNLVQAVHLFGCQIQIWKDLGPVSFWSHGPSISRGVYKIKAVVYVPNRYSLKSAWSQGQDQCLAIPTCIKNKTHLNHPRQCRVTTAILLNKGQCRCGCLFVCVFSTEIQIAGHIGMKFDRELGRFWEGRGVVQPVPHPPGMGCVKGNLEPQPLILAKTLINKSCRAPPI